MKNLKLPPFLILLLSTLLVNVSAQADCGTQLERAYTTLMGQVNQAIQANPQWNSSVVNDCRAWLSYGGSGGSCHGQTEEWQELRSHLSGLTQQLRRLCNNSCSCPSNRQMLSLMRSGGAPLLIQTIREQNTTQNSQYSTLDNVQPAAMEYQDLETAIEVSM